MFVVFVSEDIIFIVSILRYLQGDNIPKGNSGQKAMHLPLRLESIGSISKFFLSLVYSAIPRIIFLDFICKLLFKHLTNSLNVIFLAIYFIPGFLYNFLILPLLLLILLVFKVFYYPFCYFYYYFW